MFSKRFGKFLSFSLSIIFALSFFVGCSNNELKAEIESGEYSSELLLNSFDKEQDFHALGQAEFLDDFEYMGFCYPKAQGVEELSRPNAITFSWNYNNEQGKDLQNYTLKISEHKNLANCLRYTTIENFYDVYNLKVDTTYYWRVVANFVDGTSVFSNDCQMKTANVLIRNLYVDGCTNFRDLGGYVANETQKVKQGLIYRGARLNTSYAEVLTSEITEKGLYVLNDQLRIKSEIDLRLSSNNEIGSLKKSLIKDARYFNYEIDSANMNFSNKLYKDSVINTFKLLSDKNNYPVYFHCHIGTDRTGRIAGLILAVLGVNADDILIDYLFSNFGFIGGNRNSSAIVDTLIRSEIYGNKDSLEPLKEKTEEYLTKNGVKKEWINSLRNIMLETV